MGDLPAAQAVQGFVTESVRGTTAFLSTSLTSEDVLPRYDLFISMFAFTELHPDVRRHYLYKLICRSRRGFIVDNSHALRRRDRHTGVDRDPKWFDGTTGMDLVFELRQIGFTVRTSTLAEAFQFPWPEPVGVAFVISWVNTTEPYPGLPSSFAVSHDWLAQERLERIDGT